MRKSALAILGLAVSMGGFAVYLARDLIAEKVPMVAVEAPLPQTSVVVASRPLYFGDRLTAEHLKAIPWPAGTIPEGSFRSVAEVLGEGNEGRVALRNIAVNEVVLASRVSGLGGRATLSSVVTEGMRAVTIRVNDVLGVAGFVLPGDHVDILLTRQVEGSGPSDSITNILLQNIKVLAIDQDANDERAGAVVVKSVTFEVTPEHAQKLALATTVGTLSLALRNLGHDGEATTAPVSVRDLFGEPPIPEKPENVEVAAKPAPKPRRAAPATPLTVNVVRGTAASTMEVISEPVSPVAAKTPPARPVAPVAAGTVLTEQLGAPIPLLPADNRVADGSR